MSSHAGPRSRLVQVVLIHGLLLAAGCGQSHGAPSGPNRGAAGTGQGYSFRLMHWPDGLTLLVVDDIDDSHTAESKPAGYGGTATALDGRTYSWQFSARDGTAAHFEIDDRDYDCSHGSLFVIRTKGGRTQIRQLQRDMTHLDADGHDCRVFLEKDTEILKSLRIERGAR